MILSCGEALIDMLPRTTPAGESAFAPYAGGAVFNTAIAIGRLGAPSGFFSGLSSDLYTPDHGAPVSLDPSLGEGWSVPFGAELTHVIGPLRSGFL